MGMLFFLSMVYLLHYLYTCVLRLLAVRTAAVQGAYSSLLLSMVLFFPELFKSILSLGVVGVDLIGTLLVEVMARILPLRWRQQIDRWYRHPAGFSLYLVLVFGTSLTLFFQTWQWDSIWADLLRWINAIALLKLTPASVVAFGAQILLLAISVPFHAVDRLQRTIERLRAKAKAVEGRVKDARTFDFDIGSVD